MSQSHVVSNLPPILFSTNIQETVLAANGDSSISLISSDEEDQAINCFDNGDAQPTISIINSSDVVIGSVTQFHGPVTIVQHIPAIDDRKCIGTEEKNKANVDQYETTESDKQTPLPQPCISRKVLFLICLVVVSVTIVTLVLVFLPLSTSPEDSEYKPAIRNHTDHLFFTIDDWGGRPPLWVTPIINPVEWIIVSHTVGPQCQTIASCSRQMRLMQDMHVTDGNPNIGYNFVIGGDANIYEGRGWTGQNFHLFSPSSLSISFEGNYVHDVLSEEMIEAFQDLLYLGVHQNIIKPDFRIIAHNQTFATLSPGSNVYSVISNMPNFYKYLRPGMGPNS